MAAEDPAAGADAEVPEPRALAAALAVHLTRRTGRHVAADDVQVNASPLGTVVAVRGTPVARLWARQSPTGADPATWARAMLDQAPDLHARVETALTDPTAEGAPALSADAEVDAYRRRILAACHERFYGAFEEDVVVHELVKDAPGVLDGLSVMLVRGVQGPHGEEPDEAPLKDVDEDGPAVERREDGVHIIRVGGAAAPAAQEDGPVVAVRAADDKGLVVEEPIDPQAHVGELDVRRFADRVFRAVCVHWSGEQEDRTVREVEQRLRAYGEAFIVPARSAGDVDPTRYRMTVRRISVGLAMPHVILHGRDNLTLIRRNR